MIRSLVVTALLGSVVYGQPLPIFRVSQSHDVNGLVTTNITDYTMSLLGEEDKDSDVDRHNTGTVIGSRTVRAECESSLPDDDAGTSSDDNKIDVKLCQSLSVGSLHSSVLANTVALKSEVQQRTAVRIETDNKVHAVPAAYCYAKLHDTLTAGSYQQPPGTVARWYIEMSLAAFSIPAISSNSRWKGEVYATAGDNVIHCIYDADDNEWDCIGQGFVEIAPDLPLLSVPILTSVPGIDGIHDWNWSVAHDAPIFSPVEFCVDVNGMEFDLAGVDPYGLKTNAKNKQTGQAGWATKTVTDTVFSGVYLDVTGVYPIPAGQ